MRYGNEERRLGSDHMHQTALGGKKQRKAVDAIATTVACGVLLASVGSISELRAQESAGETAARQISSLEADLMKACSTENVIAAFRRDGEQDVQPACSREVRELIAALSDNAETGCVWGKATYAGSENAACVLQVSDGMYVPNDRVAILWTGKKAQYTALTASRMSSISNEKAKYISLEATQWGAILDYANRLPAWANRSSHWAVMSSVFTEKTRQSSADVPIVSGISFPRMGAFAEYEVPRIISTSFEEHIVVDLYGKEVCELERASRITNFCRRDHFGEERRDKCEQEAKAVDCDITCPEFVRNVLTKLNAQCDLVSVQGRPGAFATNLYCMDRSTPVLGLDQSDPLKSNIEGTTAYPTDYVTSLGQADEKFVTTCVDETIANGIMLKNAL